MPVDIGAIKAEYGELFALVSEALFRADPAHINYENNTDEYDPEAAAIIPRLRSARSEGDVQAILRDELLRTLWGAPVSVDVLSSLAAEVWSRWRGFNRLP